MIERASEFGASAAAPLISGDSSLQSAGDMLRAAREAHGLDVAVVAAALKVPPQKIEALEDDDIDALPDPVFARALAASMCRALRIDPKPVLAKLPDARNPGLHTRPAMSQGFHTDVPRSGNGGAGSRTLLTVVGLLVVGAAVLFWLPQSMLDQLSASVDRIMSRESGAESKPQAEAPAVVGTAPAAVAEPAPTAATAAGVQPATPQLAAIAPAASAASAAAPAAAPSTPAAAESGQLVVFNVRTESWISVTEAGGKQLVHRVVPAGETVALSGTPPLQVVVGRAAGVDVQVRGKAFDLAPLTRGGTVARFEIKP
ncbi:helix-turn-helix domain-containing protein [Variovorax sp. OV329]|uniref:helix-turn-helix domain-containing protein n=1 Tax=Variovorax sp. OV329 TaxID=1882825 RepID=UPI0008E3743E|nr:helix-turn-helix domain-containing protein [Variovorax sp. OV329]SFM39744.1 cytoskeleton protein RodZ [Variovorax sp. OV329]